MKIECISRGEQYCFRRYVLGFIPLYWHEHDGWWFGRQMIDEKEAHILIDHWKKEASKNAKYEAGRDLVYRTITL